METENVNMMEYLEQDRESLLRKLKEAGKLKEAETVIREEFDRLLLKYNEECEDAYRRDVAALLVQTARLSSGLVDSVGETRIWQEVGQTENQKKVSMKQKLFLAAACAGGVASVLSALFSHAGDSFHVTDLFMAMLMMAVAVFGGWMAGRESTKAAAGSRNAASDYHADPRVDAQHVYTCMHNMIYAADQELQRLELPDLSAPAGQALEEGPLPAALLDLCSDLLEAMYCEDGRYALDKLQSVKYYLHNHGIEVISYNGKNKELFDFMPSMKEFTLRPALVSDGKVLKRGIASGGRG